MPLSASSLRGASPPWGRRGGWRRLRGRLAKGFSLPQFSPPSERDLCKFPSCLFKGTLGLPGRLDEPRFACGDRFSLLLLPFIAHPVSILCLSRARPVSPCALLGHAGETPRGRVARGFHGTGKNWGCREERKTQIQEAVKESPAGWAFDPGGLTRPKGEPEGDFPLAWRDVVAPATCWSPSPSPRCGYAPRPGGQLGAVGAVPPQLPTSLLPTPGTGEGCWERSGVCAMSLAAPMNPFLSTGEEMQRAGQACV